ncbi:MAG: glycosyltransferase [Caldilinea sp.]|nr:glycosyltransferase [Caldilineaceae bacterium]MCB9119681.1 glycosyltransferase [Caldilineaceae bacterium]MCO5213533.1 glycosyltransferase [Caldilinea sp.]MCW5842618.1 glycosyltransferase [Caldilinea sp.]
MTSSSLDKIRCSVGVTAYNEEANIGQLLAALIDQHVHEVEIAEIIVVASACTDRTVAIVKEAMMLDERVKLIEQERREGKTSAINIFLKASSCDICVLESGDTIPHEYAVEHMVRMFRDPGVGMVGAQKVAVNTPDHITGLLSHLRLRMEHELCLEIPRLGEMIAFRKVFDEIPPDVAMDEAFVEAIVVRNGMQVRYAPDAIVYNTGPTTVNDFIRQRRRNHAGHLYLKHKYGYKVSSIQNRRVARIAFKELWGIVRLVWVIFLLAFIEGMSRVLGWYDFAIKRDRHVVWNMAWTQKQNVQDGRVLRENGNGNESFTIQTRTQLEQ